MKTYILTLIIVFLSALFSYAKEITITKLVIPTDDGITYRDTIMDIRVLDSTSVSINGKITYNLFKTVFFSKEDYTVFELYETKGEEFHLCFDINPDNSKIMQVVLFQNNQYYCFR